MRQIKALLNNGGYAVLEFPNIASVGYQIKRLMKKCGFRLNKFHPDWRPGHCNEFCRESFEYLLTKTGLELVKWETYSSKPVTNAFYQLFPIGTKARAQGTEKRVACATQLSRRHFIRWVLESRSVRSIRRLVQP